MADVASLAVGLYLNNAFTPQLTAVYRQAGDQSRRFVRGVQQDTKKAEVSYQHLASAIGGVASRLSGLAGVALSLGAVIHTSRQYSQALSDLSAITVIRISHRDPTDLQQQIAAWERDHER